MNKTLIVIPAFNCEHTIGGLIATIKTKIDNPILVVDDGSTDNTKSILDRSEVFFIQHSVNLGKGAALLSAIKWAMEKSFEYIVTLDADGQHSPLDLKTFMKSSKDLVIGARNFKFGIMPIARIFSNSLSSMLLSMVCGKNIKDSQCGYRKIRLNTIKDFLPSSTSYQFETEMILHLIMLKNGTVENVPIQTIYDGQESNIKHFRDTIEYFKALYNYYKKKRSYAL